MKFFYAFVCMSLMIACKKPEDRTCWKFAGSPTELSYELGYFMGLKLGSHLGFVLVQDTVNKLIIKGGSNLVKQVQWGYESGFLRITNDNRCYFLRKQSEVIEVEIHVKKISNIFFEGSEYLRCMNQIKSDYFSLTVNDGGGSVNLNIDALFIASEVTHGWGDYTLSGKTDVAHIGVRSNGFADASQLKVKDSLFVSSESQGSMKINADKVPVYGYIKMDGDILYTGTPTLIDVLCTSKGRMKQL